MIRILNFNHLGGKTGSARFIDTLMSGLPEEQFIFHNLVGYKFLSQDNTTSLYHTSSNWLYRNLRYKAAVGFNFLFDWMTPGCIDLKFLENFEPYYSADIIHLHCIQGGYFDWTILPEICKKKKVIMTLHDDWIVSGNDSGNLFHPYKTQKQYLKRKAILEKCNITYIGVSDWITQKVKSDGIIGSNTIKTIYNGIDTGIFYKKDKNISRKQLGLPLDKKIIISIAGSGGKSNAKGLQYVNRIIKESVNNPEYLFITLGNFKDFIVNEGLREVGYVDQDMVATYLSAADIFLYPTLMDSFGLIIVESLACGCPVVTFQTGGTGEIIDHMQNGYVAKHKDYADLLCGFKYIIDKKSQNNIILDSKFSKESLVENYVSEYLDLMKN